jgi:hypothetical protein
MARVDKTESAVGVHRAQLAAAYTGAAAPIGVGLDSNGRVVPGAGATGIIGVLCQPSNKAAADVVDIIALGELVEFAGVAGTLYTANTTTGVISSAAASVTQIPVGYTVEATRLVLKIERD